MTSETDNLIFMYGTLKTAQPNHQRLYDVDPKGVSFVGHAVTESRFPLIIGTDNNIPFLLLHDGEMGNCITGEVYKVNDATMKHLDEIECYPKIYDRKQIKVTVQPEDTEKASEPHCLQCWVYGLSRFKSSLLERPHYSEYDSAGDHNLPFIPITEDFNLKDYYSFLFDD